ncbi:hypothetical protein DI270_021405 [Microbispora triticiradicis]|uniref:Integrase n=1 Tax=Microbispora triticiradicis TaxID=2200763 RepID=A0ABX9LGH6_9ACTN|nr:hypothetical protein DI270_021405 [Microbispora triticiradicis]
MSTPARATPRTRPGDDPSESYRAGGGRLGRQAALRDLGHYSVRAAMIYQHHTAESDHEIADVMNGKITQVLPTEATGH